MFERFTDKAKGVVNGAQREAQSRAASHVRSEHLLAAGVGGNHPENRLPVASAVDQLLASVDHDRTPWLADIRRSRQRRKRHRQ